ncbi:MAG: hypothetical protein H7330_02680 [Hymenobacteraceae bacterium]|nr:hypothetical protein [Hymenobacteraceae bacterium]
MTLGALTLSLLIFWLVPNGSVSSRNQPVTLLASSSNPGVPADTTHRRARPVPRSPSAPDVRLGAVPRHTRSTGPYVAPLVNDDVPVLRLKKGERITVIMEDDAGNVVNTYYVEGHTTDSTVAATASAPVMPAPEAAAIRPDTATLAALGIQVRAGFTTFLHRIVGGGNLGIEYQLDRVVTGQYAPDPTPTAVYPWFITDLSGRESERYRLPGEDTAKRQPAYFALVLARLVPVVVPIPARDAPGHAVIFWYEATPAFLAALPPALAAEVRCAYFPWYGRGPHTSSRARPACRPRMRPPYRSSHGVHALPQPGPRQRQRPDRCAARRRLPARPGRARAAPLVRRRYGALADRCQTRLVPTAGTAAKRPHRHATAAGRVRTKPQPYGTSAGPAPRRKGRVTETSTSRFYRSTWCRT